MKAYLKITFIFAIICLSFPQITRADGTRGIDGPYIQENLGLIIKNLIIKIKNNKITVKYTIKNNHYLPIQKVFNMIIPPYALSNDILDSYDQSFKSIEVKINNKKVKLTDNTRAFFEGNDITEELKKIKINPIIEDINTFNKDIEKNDIQKQFLLEKKYISLWEYKDKKAVYGTQWWTAPQYSFTHKFEQNTYTTLEYKYTFIPYISYDNLQNILSGEFNRLGPNVSDILMILKDADHKNEYYTNWIYQNLSSLGAGLCIDSIDIYASSENNNAPDPCYVYIAIGDNNSSGLNKTELHIKNFIIGGNLFFFTARALSRNSE